MRHSRRKPRAGVMARAETGAVMSHGMALMSGGIGLHREARDLRIRLDREWNPAERMRTEGRLREVQDREARAGCR